MPRPSSDTPFPFVCLIQNLYVVGELAMHLIQRRTKTHHWTLDSYPGHIKMPGDLFRPMVDKDEVQKNRIRVYLPEETLKSLRDVKVRSFPPLPVSHPRTTSVDKGCYFLLL